MPGCFVHMFSLWGWLCFTFPSVSIETKRGRCHSGLPNKILFKKYNLKSAIQKQSTQHTPLTDRAKRFDKWVAKRRYKVERVLGSIPKLVWQCRRALYRAVQNPCATRFESDFLSLISFSCHPYA